MSDDTPRYPHHCPNCVFLGQVGGEDLYYCEAHSIDHPFAGVVRRWGRDRGQSGWTRRIGWHLLIGRGLAAGMQTAAVDAVAVRLASARGLVPKTAADNVLAGIPEEAG